MRTDPELPVETTTPPANVSNVLFVRLLDAIEALLPGAKLNWSALFVVVPWLFENVSAAPVNVVLEEPVRSRSSPWLDNELPVTVRPNELLLALNVIDWAPTLAT